MTALPWSSVVPLDASHDVAQFCCGLESVDSWFREQALNQSGRVRTHLCVDPSGGIVAFYALRHVVVSVEGASSRLRGMGEVGYNTPGLLLAQMGVHVDHQGGGAGRALVEHVMKSAAAIHAQASFRLLIVDAENDNLVAFYEMFGFKSMTGGHRMAMRMTAVARVVAAL